MEERKLIMKIRLLPVLALFTCFLLLIIIFYFSNITLFVNPSQVQSIRSLTTSSKITTKNTIVYQGKTYEYVYFSVADTSKIVLSPNFDRRIDSKSLIKEFGCAYAINGGFYDTDYKPIGLWKNDSETLHEEIESALFKGFYYVDNAKAYISLTAPSSARIALQTGPMLILNGSPTRLSIKNDTYERRMIAAVLSNDTTIFMAIFNNESVYEGPKLADLPYIVFDIGKDKEWLIKAALNLDGGSASAFITPERSLQELTPVGSIFCVDEI